MGTTSSKILGNDDSMDVYYSFEDLYYKKENLDAIKNKIVSDFSLIDKNGNIIYNANRWTAYALICWECRSLDEATFKIVEKIVKEQIDLGDWENLKEEREKVLKKFLKKISVPNKTIKKIPKFFKFIPPYKQGDCFIFKYKDGNYGGAVCFEVITENRAVEYYGYVIGITRINQNAKPTLNDFLKSHILVYNFGKTMDNLDCMYANNPVPQVMDYFTGKIKSAEELQRLKDRINDTERIGSLKVMTPMTTKTYSPHFRFSEIHEHQFAWEKNHPQAIDLQFPISKYCAAE